WSSSWAWNAPLLHPGPGEHRVQRAALLVGLPGFWAPRVKSFLRGPGSAPAVTKRQKAKTRDYSSVPLLGGEHHDHLPPFELGHVLDHGDVGQLVADPLEQAHADLLVGDLAAPEAQRDLALVAVLGDEAAQVAHLDVVVALVRARTEL